MANLQWNFSREGSVRLKDSVRQIIYHKSLNVVVVVTQDANSIVIDVNNGSTLHRSCLVPPDQGKHGPERINQLSCLALPEHSALIVTSDQAVGLRQDLGQVLLLESILQVPVTSQDAVVRIELPTTEAVQLLHCLQSLDLSGEPDLLGHREQVSVALTQQIRQSYQSKTKFKAASWGIIHLDLPLYYLRTLCLHAVQDMRRHNRHVLALPVVSSLAIRTAVLLGDNHQTGLSLLASQSMGSSEGTKEHKSKTVGPSWKIAWDKVGEGEGSVSSPIATTATGGPGHSWMVSEAVRRETFNRWPHMKYKWALPAQMAEAGFYHQPSTPESDRAVCFHCNVCLICWEPNDEPWSEHERHAPLCQFVKGEYTQNVPMETTLATYPALMHSDRGDRITCLSTVSSEEYAATASEKGLVVLWNISGLLRRELSFKVDCRAIDFGHANLNIEALSVLGAPQKSDKRDSEASKARPCLVVGVALKSTSDSGSQVNEEECMEVEDDARDRSNEEMVEERPTTLELNSLAKLCLFVYDVCPQNGGSGTPPTGRDHPDAVASTSAASTGAKSGASKKQSNQKTSSGTQQECNLYNQNRDMFYSVNDDALVEEMVALAEDPNAGPSLRSKFKKIASFSYEVGQASSNSSQASKASTSQVEQKPSISCKKEADTVATPQLVQRIDLTPFLPENSEEASILSLTPSHDGKYLLAVVGPKPEPEVRPPQRGEASFPTLLTTIDHPTPSLMSNESQESQLRALWEPTHDEKEASGARSSASDLVGALILLAVEQGQEVVALQSQPIVVQHIRREQLPVAVVMLPRTRNDTAVVLVGQDGKLRLYDLLKLELKAEMSHEDKFVSATYCTNAERLCASTGEGQLCFYRVELSNNFGDAEGDFLDGVTGFSDMEVLSGMDKGKGKGKSPLKLQIHQPLTLENLQELYALTECENIPQGFSAVIPPCWMELPQAQKLRRQPQPLRAVGDEAHHTRTWRLQPEGATWDEHLLEISIPQSWTIGHIDVRFTLMPDITCVPPIQVSLLEHRSTGKTLGKNKAWAADEDQFTEVDRGLDFSPLSGSTTNPVLTNEFLEMHDAALVCGPVALDACLDGTGHNGIVTLASPLLLAARSRNYLLHFKYLPQVESHAEQDPVVMQWPFKSNSGSKSALERLSLGGTRRPCRGCDVLQEISVCVRKTSPNQTPRDKLQRYMMVSDANFVGKLRDEIIRKSTSRTSQNLALDILIWIVTVCSGTPDTEQTKKDSKVRTLILQELSKNLAVVIDRVWIKGNRTSAKKMAKLVLACLQLGKDSEESKSFQKQLLEAQLKAFPELVACTSPTAVYWFTVVLSRIVSWDPNGVSNVAWSLLIRVSQMYQVRAHPLHLLVQARFGLYGKPFEPALFTLPSLGSVNMDGFLESPSSTMGPSMNLKDGSNSTAAVAGRIALDGKFSLSAAGLISGAEGGEVKQVLKRGCGIPQFLAKDFSEAEPLVVTLCQASEGTRLEKLDTGPSAFGSTSSAGFVKTNPNSTNGGGKLSEETGNCLRWEHLLRAPHSYAWLLERLHSGGRKFVTLDLGQPVLLTDVCIPACPEFVCLAVDVWLEREETDGCRLTLATDIASKPIVLLDLQPPPLCRYIKLSVVGRYGMSTTFVKANLGMFYGHTVLLPNDTGVKNHAAVLQPDQIQAELDVVEGLADQVLCHYHLASSKLQTVLLPLLDTRRCDPVVSHVEHYLKSQLENPGSLHNVSKDQANEADKVFSVYEECLKLQLQWNTLKGVARRLRRALGEVGVLEVDGQEKDSEEALDDAGSDKLQFVAHSLVNLLLCVTSSQKAARQDLVNEGACQMLFERLLVAAPPALQLSGASLLAHHCGSKNWWGNFLAKIVQKYLAFRSEDPWPQDRIFFTLTFMAHKTLAISTCKILDAIGQSLCQSLDTLDTSQSPTLSMELSRVDLSAVNWHLLFMNYLLDRLSSTRQENDESCKENVAVGNGSKSSKNWSNPRSTGSRWDFLQGEFSLNKVNPLASSRSSAGRLFRRKLQKRLFHHKQQWEELELKKVFENPASDLPPLANSFKKSFSSYKTPFGAVYSPAKDNGNNAQALVESPSKDTSNATGEESHREKGPVMSWHQAVLLARKLVQLLLLVAENQQLDLVLLIAKVLGKMALVVRPVLHLGDIMTTQSLVKMLQLAVKPSTTFGDAVDHQWMSHAVTCLLRDFLSESKNASTAGPSNNNFVVVNPANVEDAKALFGDEVKAEGAVGGNVKEEAGKKKISANVEDEEQAAGSNTADVDLLVTGLMEGASDFALGSDVYDMNTGTKSENVPGVPGLSAMDSATQKGSSVFQDLRSFTLSPEHFPFLAAANLPTTSMGDAGSAAGLTSKEQANGEVETFISKLLESYPYVSDSLAKPLNSSRVVRVFPVKEDALNEDMCLSTNSSAGDNRLETRVEGFLGQKIELFCLLNQETVYQVLVSPVTTNEVRRKAATVAEDSLPSLCTATNVSMLSVAFNQIFAQYHNTMATEAISTLRLWMQINLEVSESSVSGVYEATTVPVIVLSSDSIRNLLAVFARQPQMEVGAWCTLFQAISWLCNLRCTTLTQSSGTEVPSPSRTNNGDYASGLEDLAGGFLAGGILRDPSLVPLLHNFLSGYGLPPSSNGDRCWVGPTVTSALSDLLMRLRLWCSISTAGSRLGTELRRSLLGLVLQLCQPGGAIASGRGPLDAQFLLLDSMLKLMYEGADTPTCIAVVDAIAVLVCNRMEGCQPVMSSSSGSHVVNPFLCFGGLVLDHASKETVGSQALTTQDHIFASLLQLAAKLASIPLNPAPQPSTTAASTSPLLVLVDEPLTDSSKIEQAESSHPQTDESKVEQQNERSNHNRPQQSTFLADLILQQPSVVLSLLASLSHCQASALALTLGPATLSSGKFPFGDPSSIGDHVIHLLLTLLEKTTSPGLLIAPLCNFLTLSQNTTGLSDPLLWFVLRALNNSKLVQDFRVASGIALVAHHVSRAHVALANSQPALVPNIIRYLGLAASQAVGAGNTTGSNALSGLNGSSNSTNNKVGASLGSGILNGSAPATASTGGLVPGRKTPASSLESVEGLLNFAPLGSVTSSNPSAQPADALLVSVPPHRRARTPAWSHHFYPSEHWVELTITLPCAILLHEVQLQPHLTSLATCPAAIALEVSAESPASLSPVSGPVNTSGLAFISLKLPCPQVAHTVLIRLYRPRDSSNVGLAQLRVLGSLAVPTGPLARNLTTKTPGVHPSWIHILHHCVEITTGQAQNEILNSLISLPYFVKGCCGHFVTLSSSASTASHKSDLKAKMHSLILKLSRYDMSVGLQCLQWFLDAESGGEGVAHLVYDLCLTRDEFVSQRLQCLLRWLQTVVQNQAVVRSTQMALLIHCSAAVLWAWQENTDVSALVAPFELSQLAPLIYAWSLEVERQCHEHSNGLSENFDDSNLKKALDFTLCTLAYVNGRVMDQAMSWMGVACARDPELMDTSLTDDSKGNAATSASTSSATSWSSTALLLGLKPGQLSTLARTAQSPLAARKFFDSGLVNKLAQFVLDYCHQEAPEWRTDAGKEQKTGFSRPRAQAVTQVLRFFTQICTEGGLRNLLIEHLGPNIMSVLIATFCSPYHVSRTEVRSSELEDAVVRFLQVFCWAHRENQRRLAQALYSVLSDRPVYTGTGRYGYPVLTGFTRRLFFQLVLETEKLYLFVQSSEALPDHIVAADVLEPRHPKYGVGPQRRLIEIGASCTATQVLDWLTNGSSPRLSRNSPFLKPNEEIPPAGNTDAGAKSSTTDAPTSAFASALSLSDQLNSVLGTLKEKRAKIAHNLRGISAPFRLGSNLNPFSKASIAQSLRSGLQCVLASPTLHLSEWPGAIPGHVTVSQLYTWLERKGKNLDPPCIHLNISFSRERAERMDLLERVDAFPTILQDFASIGGLALLAQYLPLLTSDMPLTCSVSATGAGTSGSSHGAGGFSGNEPLDVWVKIEENDDFDDEIEEIIMSGSMLPGSSSSTSKKFKGSLPLTLPQHSLVAFSLFLRIPLYADALLRDRRRAQMLLRLALGVCDDGEGGDILGSQECASLPILPFSLLKQLLITQPPSTDDGCLLRKKALEVGALQLLLGCLGVFTQQLPSATINVPGLGRQFVITAPSGVSGKKPVPEVKRNGNGSNVVASKPSYDKDLMASDEETLPMSTADILGQTSTTNVVNGVPAMPSEQAPQYWAKGTGFGTGSTAQSWDVEEALLRQKAQEEHTVCLLQTLAAYLRPELGEVMEEAELEGAETKDCLPEGLTAMLRESCLLQAVCSYLRNDSVMDMARHVPLYKALLLLVRAIAQCSSLSSLLCCSHNDEDSSDVSIFNLLGKMKDYVSIYSARIAATRSRLEETDADGGLADLITDITNSWSIVEKAVQQTLGTGVTLSNMKTRSFLTNAAADLGLLEVTPEQRYMDVMRKLQFETFEMLVETEGGGYKFTVPFHFEGAVRLAGERSYPTRMKRLAQEAATLLTSLPLSFSSSVFVRCDTDRLDVMKVLITGPADTPYANGCYEFDVYFPVDYPQSPMQIHLCTTGRQTVRFNPNLYNDGKVCLSVLNTWHGRPEEKWNPSTSSFLQVLVSIQSLILVSEPYFNEPGYERSRGTASGTQNSRDYDANIRQANIRWAMLEQLRNPSACFRDVVRAHFWLKREEIERQIENWLEEMEMQVAQEPADTRAVSVSLLALERHYSQLKEEMSRLLPPESVEEPVSMKRKSKSDEDEFGAAAKAERNSNSDCVDDKDVSTEAKQSSEVPDADNKKSEQEESCEPMLWSQDYGGIPPESWALGSDEDSDEFDSFISQFII